MTLPTFYKERDDNINKLGSDQNLRKLGMDFLIGTAPLNYTYNFSWMGRPIIQFPQDIVAMQEIIWNVKPDLIIETGVAHGGSLALYAGLMKMMDLEGKVLGIDIDIRPSNMEAIQSHFLKDRIELIVGSSIDEKIVEQVKKFATGFKNIMVILDSNHTHDHVLKELELYSGFVSKNNYLVVFDTVVEDMPKGWFKDRPWDVGNNPKTAVHEFLKSNENFMIDDEFDKKLLISVAPNGYLKRVK
jgi:cephalosporin hydroxylase